MEQCWYLLLPACMRAPTNSIKLVITGLGFSQPPQILQLYSKMNSAISNLFVRQPRLLSQLPGEILDDELQSPKFLNSKLLKKQREIVYLAVRTNNGLSIHPDRTPQHHLYWTSCQILGPPAFCKGLLGFAKNCAV